MTVLGYHPLPMTLPVDRSLAEQIFRVHGWTALLLLAGMLPAMRRPGGVRSSVDGVDSPAGRRLP